MMQPLFSKGRIRAAAGGLSIFLLLAACQTPAPEPAAGGTGPFQGGAEAEARQDDSAAALPLGPEAGSFVGKEVAELERLLGPPALVRAEGGNEFRRYDLQRCRAFAVVAPAGGLVQTVATGALVSGDAAPSFPVCTRGL